MLAALCQEGWLVPIVEPEVLMNGADTIDRRKEVTGAVLHAGDHALFGPPRAVASVHDLIRV